MDVRNDNNARPTARDNAGDDAFLRSLREASDAALEASQLDEQERHILREEHARITESAVRDVQLHERTLLQEREREYVQEHQLQQKKHEEATRMHPDLRVNLPTGDFLIDVTVVYPGAESRLATATRNAVSYVTCGVCCRPALERRDVEDVLLDGS